MLESHAGLTLLNKRNIVKKYHRDRIAKNAQLFDRCAAFLKRPKKEDFKAYLTPSQQNLIIRYGLCSIGVGRWQLANQAQGILTNGKKAKIMRLLFRGVRVFRFKRTPGAPLSSSLTLPFGY